MAIGLIPSHLREFFGQLNLCGLSCKYLFSVCHLSFDFALVVFAMQNLRSHSQIY